MKKAFSKKWNSSKQPRKQRKYKANAPLHVKRKMMASNLNKDLRKKYGKRNVVIRKGDSVSIMRGQFKKKTGKIGSVDLKKLRVSIEGIQRTKKDGTKVNVWFNASNLQIKELNLDDKKRMDSIERGKKKIEEKKSSSSDKKEAKSDTNDNKIKSGGDKK